MLGRFFRTVGILLATSLLCATISPLVVAQQFQKSDSNARSYSAAPRELQMPARNFGDVFAGAYKQAGVRMASAEEPIQSGAAAFQNGQHYDSGDVVYEGEMCGEECCDCCPSVGYGTLYARAEYMFWWLSGDTYPPLVTSSPQGTPFEDAGVLSDSDTDILFGNKSFNDGGRSGARFVLGVSLTPCTRLEGDWFTLGSKGAEIHRSSEGDPILARPFFNLENGIQDANVIAYPGLFDGRVDIRASTQFMGAGVHLARNLSYQADQSGCGYHRLDLVYGFRYLGLYEEFDADSSSTVTNDAAGPPAGTQINVSDSFSTSNSFFGGNIGVLMEANRGRWILTSGARIGIGGTRERVAISGSTTVTQPGEESATFNGGLLALPTNIGEYSNNAFSLVPHLELRVAYLLTPRMRWTLGYDLMYWSRVVRPGDQIDLFVNPSQASDQPLTGTPGPLFDFKETDLWMQGITTGLEVHF